jgi:hypothetical protein
VNSRIWGRLPKVVVTFWTTKTVEAGVPTLAGGVFADVTPLDPPHPAKAAALNPATIVRICRFLKFISILLMVLCLRAL